MAEQTLESNPSTIGNLVVVGLGLIGGSLAKAIRMRQAAQKVWGVALTQSVCDRAVELGIVDNAVTNLQVLASSLGAGDVIFIAVPTLSIKSVMQQIHACVSSEVTITDGASVKGSVFKDVQNVYGRVPPQIVLGHPIAGSEKSGVEAANPDLYVKHRVILTPTVETGAGHLARVTAMWQAVEAEVLHLEIEEHDEILGATSHLPHAIAFSLVDTLANDSQNQNIFRYAAGGFRDFTRIASSDAVMWRDIMLANDKAVIKAIDLFTDNLLRLRSAIEQHDEKAMLGVFTRAKAARDHFSNMLARKAYSAQETARKWDVRVNPSTLLNVSIDLPGDKSISHRSVMLGAIAEGTTEITGFLEGEDALATIQALRDMGVVIDGPHAGKVTVYGVGLLGLQQPSGPIYLGNAGTSLRLLCGILAAQSFSCELFGDDSLNARPMERIAEPLRLMGASIQTSHSGTPPVMIDAVKRLNPIDYRLPIASAQVKSCLLLAGLYADGTTRIEETSVTRDHTERLLQSFGCKIHRKDTWIEISGTQKLQGCSIEIPGDFSSAMFMMVAASICPGSELLLKRVGVNPTRTGAINVLQAMGADVQLINASNLCTEPVADIRVKYAPLKGVCIPADLVSVTIDEFPALLIAAAYADGITQLSGASELRLKESDRIQAMAEGLTRMGVACTTTEDGMRVTGGALTGGEVDSYGDHRVAMAFAIAGIGAMTPVTVKNCANIATSFPAFFHTCKQLGIRIERIDH